MSTLLSTSEKLVVTSLICSESYYKGFGFGLGFSMNTESDQGAL
jgi:hypothetical protein